MFLKTRSHLVFRKWLRMQESETVRQTSERMHANAACGKTAPDWAFSPAAASRRLLQGFSATALSPVVITVAQLVSVPVFLRFWGPNLYGEWLLLSTVPSYLSLSDMGFGSVAGNDMTMRVAARDRIGALSSFQSAWVMICAISAAVSVLAVSAGYLLPLNHWLNVASMSQTEFRGVLLLLICYALGSLQTTLAVSGFRCDGNYALAALLLNILKLVEALGTAAAVALGARPVLAAEFLVIVRWGGHLLLCLVLRRRSPWIVWGIKHASRASVRQMLRPASAFMAFPLGNALSIQGMLLIVGIVLGPLAVTVFSTTRTLTRVGFMILETIRQSIWPEMSAAFGAENWAYARKLHGKACQVSVLLCAAAVLFLAIFGRRIYVIWTHRSVTFSPSLFYTLLAVVIADSLWSASSVTSLACNAHQAIAAAYLGGTVISLALAYISMTRLGLLGPALALLIIDIPMTRYVLRNSLSVLHDTPRGFFHELCTAPNLRGLTAHAIGKES